MVHYSLTDPQRAALKLAARGLTLRKGVDCVTTKTILSLARRKYLAYNVAIDGWTITSSGKDAIGELLPVVRLRGRYE